jgi:hypothetical protein
MPPKSAQEFLNDCIRARGLAPYSVEDGCADAARLLFSEIYDRLGKEAAWQIFGEFKPPAGHKRKWMHDQAMLDRYDFRHSQGWGPERVAKEIAEDNAKINEANKTLPRGQWKRGLCNGSTTVKTIERRLNRVLSARREIAERYALRQQQLKEGILAEAAGNACPWSPGVKP